MSGIRDHFFRNIELEGDPIVEAIEQLQRDVESINGTLSDISSWQTTISGNIEELYDDVLRISGNLSDFFDEYIRFRNKILGGDYTFVKWHGAAGDGVTDDTAAIQAALDSGKTYIIFDKGRYLVSSSGYGDACLKVNSNTHLIGLGATIINYTPSSIAIVNKSPALTNPTLGGGYTANGNIIIEELNFVGTNESSLGMIGFSHCHDVKIINCNFEDIGGWHFIELNSTRNAIISGCHFSNYVGTNLTEMVQLDMATNADVFPFFGPYDGTNTHNVLIKDCTFENPSSFYEDSNHYFDVVPAAIGNHNATASASGNVHHIHIINCTFENMHTCLKFSALRNSIISGNNAVAVRHFFNMTNPESESTDFFAGLKICDNRLITSPLPSSIITVSQSTRTRCIGFAGINCEISNNDIYGWSGYAICVNGSGHVIVGNSITSCGRKGIYLYGNDNIVCNDNKVYANCSYGMAGDHDITVMPDGNSAATRNTIISGNLFGTVGLSNPGAVGCAFVNNVIKTSVTKSASDDTIYHNNLVNGSWTA